MIELILEVVPYFELSVLWHAVDNLPADVFILFQVVASSQEHFFVFVCSFHKSWALSTSLSAVLAFTRVICVIFRISAVSRFKL